MKKKILVFLSLDQNKIKKSSCALTQKIAELSEKLNAEIIGLSIGNQEMSEIDIHNIVVDHYYHMKLEDLNLYNINQYNTEILKVLREFNPLFLLGIAGSLESELFPWIAAAFRVNMISNCIDIEQSDGEVVVKRNIYGGKVDAYLRLQGKSPYILTFINDNCVSAVESKNIRSKQLSCNTAIDVLKGMVIEQSKSNNYEQDISDSSIVLAGGRGIKGKENFNGLKHLSKLLGAATGASRAIVDEGIAPTYMQIGQTGRVISPEIYLAFGISGSQQHLAGMSNSRTIIAINSDPNANIFKIAQYGILCDAPSMINKLTQMIEKNVKKEV